MLFNQLLDFHSFSVWHSWFFYSPFPDAWKWVRGAGGGRPCGAEGAAERRSRPGGVGPATVPLHRPLLRRLIAAASRAGAGVQVSSTNGKDEDFRGLLIAEGSALQNSPVCSVTPKNLNAFSLGYLWRIKAKQCIIVRWKTNLTWFSKFGRKGWKKIRYN